MTAAERLAQRQQFQRDHVRYVIRYSWRRPGGCRPGAKPQDWRSWRCFASVPVLFHNYDAAHRYFGRVGFKNLGGHRKLSSTIERIII